MKLEDKILKTAFIMAAAFTIIFFLLPPTSAQEITIYPTTFTNLTGDWDGTPGDLNNSATFNILNETNGNPGFLAVANFTEVRSEPATYTLFFKRRYNGTVGHANKDFVQYFDCISETWTTFGTATNFLLETHTVVVDTANIRCSDGNSSIRIIHDTGGTTTHIEEIYLISMSAIVPTDPVIHVHFTADPPSACSICEISIHWANSTLTQNLNFSIDGAAQVDFCTACTDEHLELVGLSNGSHNITIFSSTQGNVTKTFIIRDPSYYEYPEQIWSHNETERTTNNWFDRVLGGDIMTNEILFFLVIIGGSLWIAFKTPGRANIPFFGFASIGFTVIGLFILSTEPFDSFGVDVAGRGLLNITAVFIFWAFAGIITIYAGLGEWRRIQNR